MAVYLLKPANLSLSVQMMKYTEIIRGLADVGRTRTNMTRYFGPSITSGVGLGVHQLGDVDDGVTVHHVHE